jgi:DNA polymerase-3 subunit alpha
MAAAMTLDAGNTDQLQVLVDDARALGLTVLPPCVNESVHRFIPVNASSIRYGLGGLKGAGENAAIAIEAERTANGDYLDLLDFCTRVDKHAVNRRAVEALIRSGGFDRLEVNRAKLLASVDAAMSAAEAAAESAGQDALFGLDEAPALSLPHLENIQAWTLVERLREEKAALGYHFSGHLFDAYAATARALGTTPLNELKPGGKKSGRVDPWVAGIVRAIRIQIGKKGKMAYVTLDDRTGLTEIAVFSDTFNAAQSLLTADTFLALKVRVIPTDTGGMRISAADVVGEDGLWAQRCGHVNITLAPELDRNTGADVFRLIKSNLGNEGASLTLTVQQAGSMGELNMQGVYLKTSAANIAALRTHTQVEKLTFSVGEAKMAQNADDMESLGSAGEYDIPDDLNHTLNAAYSDADIPAYDAEYDYA